jgi:hypothetical protein
MIVNGNKSIKIKNVYLKFQTNRPSTLSFPKVFPPLPVKAIGSSKQDDSPAREGKQAAVVKRGFQNLVSIWFSIFQEI